MRRPSIAVEPVGRLVDPQGLLDPVKASPVLRGDVALAAVDVRVEVAEGAGDRLDPLEVHARGGVRRLGGLDVPGLDRLQEGLGRVDEVARLLLDVGVVVGDGLVEQRLVDRCRSGQVVEAASVVDSSSSPHPPIAIASAPIALAANIPQAGVG